MSNAWVYPFIILGGILQAAGAPINGALVNPWLASAVSFLLVMFLAIALFLMQPAALPTIDALRNMKWWAPLGGIVGAAAGVSSALMAAYGAARPVTAPSRQSMQSRIASGRNGRFDKKA
ncbi:Integral membrane protein [Candidatus Burkholderia humilis]|nr:Integral membrane protein [Candidatus Burkholderia humilis]